VLDITNLNVRIKGSDVLRDVDMHLPAGSFGAVVGRNGAGKTTLMRTLMGLQKAASGRIMLDGRDTTHAPAYIHAGHGIGYMPEDRRLVPQWTVEQNILLPLWVKRNRKMRTALDMTYGMIPELVEHRERKALQLSGGQQKLVALARAIVVGHRMIFLDEPFEGVVPALAERLSEVLARMKRIGSLTVLIAESTIGNSPELFTHVFEIERGVVRVVGLR
jgi:branched-chain amino acid transport system ATP-binding protein